LPSLLLSGFAFPFRGIPSWAQREGGPIEEIRPADVVWFAPNEKHWYCATPTTAMTYIAIQEGSVREGEKVIPFSPHELTALRRQNEWHTVYKNP
jgi:hypothetical protein